MGGARGPAGDSNSGGAAGLDLVGVWASCEATINGLWRTVDCFEIDCVAKMTEIMPMKC